jgi:hypothetical protein
MTRPGFGHEMPVAGNGRSALQQHGPLAGQATYNFKFSNQQIMVVKRSNSGINRRRERCREQAGSEIKKSADTGPTTRRNKGVDHPVR